MPKENILIHIMAKAPIAKWCNTRIGVTLGHEHSATLQKCLIDDLIRFVDNASYQYILHIGLPRSQDAKTFSTEEIPDPVDYNHMIDLGQAMASALSTSRTSYPSTYHVFIGVDSPVGVMINLEKVAIDRDLDETVWIGPTYDGGIYLLGVPPSWQNPFEDIAWGTANVYAQLTHRVKQLGVYKVKILEKQSDLDESEDIPATIRSMNTHKLNELKSFLLLSQWNTLGLV
ncbi:MAG: DUF2064 domain-containing protein [Bdellovibrionales bacterium]|nr:DUF2064 domain-containing protein [Bdellovibrionales bacterium]